MFWRSMSLPSSGLKSKPSRKPAWGGQLPAYSSTPKKAVTCSSETLVGFQWTTWHYIPKIELFQNHGQMHRKWGILLIRDIYISWRNSVLVGNFSVCGNQKEVEWINQTGLSKVVSSSCIQAEAFRGFPHPVQFIIH
jgi:hypothetical protein